MESENAGSEPIRLTGADFGFGSKTQLGITGFSVICAWHFLVLFSGLFSNEGRLFVYQLVLFCSLALTYFVLSAFSERIEHLVLAQGLTRFRTFNICVGVLGSASAAALAYLSETVAPNAYALAGLYVVMGFSEATLIYPWLQMPRATHRIEAADYRNLAFNMGLGSLIALVVANLQHPLYEILASLLPFVSSLLLIVFWGTPQALKQLTSQAQGQLRKIKLGQTLKENIGFVFCGIAFGLLQAVFAQDGRLVYLCGSVWPVLGVTVSAIVIFALPSRWLRAYGVSTMQRFSYLFIMVGAIVMVCPLASSAAGFGDNALVHLLSQGLVLCGFNIFDFGYMVFAFIWAAKMKGTFAPYVAYNRAIMYASMALGLVGGWALTSILGQGDALALIAVEICIVLLAVTTMPPLDNLLPYSKIMAAEALSSKNNDAPEEEGLNPKIRKRVRFNELVDLVSETYGLSRREKEVFRCLAKGRNATYIQQELTISINTARTHISNIYRKLDVHSLQDLLDLMDAVASEHAPDLKEEQNGGEGGSLSDEGASGEGVSGARGNDGRA